MASQKPTTTALAKVYNPKPITGGKIVKGAKTNPVKKTTPAKATNPINKTVKGTSSKGKPKKKNPASMFGMLGAALMVGLGTLLFDLLTTRFMPQQSIYWRVGLKAGGAIIFQSQLASKIPVIGKYKNEIALFLGATAILDLLRTYALPVADNMTGGLLTGNTAAKQIAMTKVDDGDELGADTWLIEEKDATEYEDDDYDEDDDY